VTNEGIHRGLPYTQLLNELRRSTVVNQVVDRVGNKSGVCCNSEFCTGLKFEVARDW
jgi:hypothetical protein